MVALSREDAAALLTHRKPGPVGRNEVHRPVVCPEGHLGANIRFDRMGGTDPQYARANYRCARLVTLDDGAKVEVHHRFVLRGGEDPLRAATRSSSAPTPSIPRRSTGTTASARGPDRVSVHDRYVPPPGWPTSAYPPHR
jgi:hypothetical protein